ncbi:MAG: hypothetical protein ABJB85_08845 [Nitrososphaerota archaeon]
MRILDMPLSHRKEIDILFQKSEKKYSWDLEQSAVGQKFNIYIFLSGSRTVAGIRVLLRCKRCDSDFYAGGIVSSESSFLGSDYGKSKKECPFCMWSETYFQEDYFLDRT